MKIRRLLVVGLAVLLLCIGVIPCIEIFVLAMHLMDQSERIFLWGVLTGFMGAILGGLAEAGFSYSFEELRYRREERRRWYRMALEWAARGQKDSLRRADLRHASLQEIDLGDADLIYAILIGSDLRKANLSKAHLSGADLFMANLSWADRSGADLSEDDLSFSRDHYVRQVRIMTPYKVLSTPVTLLIGANLRGADLSYANLRWVDLRRADLSEADLKGANFTGAYLYEAKVTPEQLAQAAFLKGATLPDGTKHD